MFVSHGSFEDVESLYICLFVFVGYEYRKPVHLLVYVFVSHGSFDDVESLYMCLFVFLSVMLEEKAVRM